MAKETALILIIVAGLCVACQPIAAPDHQATPPGQESTLSPSATPYPTATATPAATPTVTPSATPVPEQENASAENNGVDGIIAFYSDRDGNPDIYTMNADGSNVTRLTNDPGFDDSPALSPDGAQIVFLTARHDPSPNFPDLKYEIYVMASDGSNPRRLTETDAAEDHPAWSPDGSKIIFDADYDGYAKGGLMDIQHKHIEACLAATAKFVVQRRADIGPILAQLAQELPEDAIAGAPFALFQFVTSVTDGYDAEIGFPVNRKVTTPFPNGAPTLHTRVLPAMEVLALVHQDAPEKLRETYGKLYAYAAEHAIISDEFGREVYADAANPGGPGTEAQFIIHDWDGKLAHGLERVLGQETHDVVMQGSEALSIASRVDDRFLWAKGMLERLDGLADEHQKYDILSGCAHVFPLGQVAKLKAVFDEAYVQTHDGLQAVDAVLDFMEADPGWSETRPTREGYTIYAAKGPRDPQAYAEAQTDLERRSAYCFCPLIRDNLDQGMPTAFCYCGSGWYRRQFEVAIGKPVSIDIVSSVLRGDDVCQFAIHLPEEL